MSYKRKLLQTYLDLDGVLVDLVAACEPLLNKKIDTYFFTDEAFFEKLDEDFWANLPPTKEFDNVLKLLDNITICTYAVTPAALFGKEAWCKKYLGNLPVVYTKHKEKLAHPTALLIDDYDAHYENFSEHGHAILFPRPWNKNSGLDPIQHLEEKYNEILRLSDCIL